MNVSLVIISIPGCYFVDKYQPLGLCNAVNCHDLHIVMQRDLNCNPFLLIKMFPCNLSDSVLKYSHY